MKLFKTLLAFFIIFSSVSAFAVTDKEMEKARTTTAKIYLRWANDKSGYLDEINPASMAELESSLKDQEKQNLQAFKNAGLPSNYSSWNKEELVKYWSQTFFQNAKGLSENGSNQGARARMKNELNKMSIADPAPAPDPAPVLEQEVKEEVPAPAPVAAPVDNQAANPGYSQAIQDTKDALSSNKEEEAALQQAAANDNEGSSGTWIYVLILVILVAIVVFLVIYASKTMKNGNLKKNDESRRTVGQDYAEADSLGGNLSKRLAAKQSEVNGLNNVVSEMQAQIDELSATVARLRKENARLRKENEEKSVRLAALPVPDTSVVGTGVKVQPENMAPEVEQHPESRDIFLGRVNSNGIFVRADRTFSPGNSVYRMVTTDGYSGTYYVVDNPALEMLALENPEEYLAGGCVAKDIADTVGKTSIVTETAGTAIFEKGAWKVIRKARIRYE